MPFMTSVQEMEWVRLSEPTHDIIALMPMYQKDYDCHSDRLFAGAMLATSFILSNSVPIYLSMYVCLSTNTPNAICPYS